MGLSFIFFVYFPVTVAWFKVVWFDDVSIAIILLEESDF